MDENIELIANLHDEIEELTLKLQNANTFAQLIYMELIRLKEQINVKTDK